MSSRWASSANETEAAKDSISLVTLVELDFPSGTLYLHDAGGRLTYNGNTYLGCGQLGSVSGVAEDTDITAKTITLTLSGADANIVSLAMTDKYQNRSAIVSVGLLDFRTGQFVDNPDVAWAGKMDVMVLTLDQNQSAIQLTCQSRLRQGPRIALMTDTDQQIAYPGDTFFNRITDIPNYRSNWGAVGGVTYTGGSNTGQPTHRNDQP